MIASLRGELVANSTDRLIIDVGGVGYDVAFCQSGLRHLPEIGKEVFLHIYTKVREDAIELFGFIELSSKEMFVTLLGVSGVGPKVALGLLSAAQSAEIAQAIIHEDIHSLTKLPGIGKKTAERLCLELKEKVHGFIEQTLSPQPITPLEQQNSQVADDVVSALVNLGYPQAHAKRSLQAVLKALPEDQPAPPIEEILRLALRSLA